MALRCSEIAVFWCSDFVIHLDRMEILEKKKRRLIIPDESEWLATK
jgi:hypothetical protein